MIRMVTSVSTHSIAASILSDRSLLTKFSQEWIAEVIPASIRSLRVAVLVESTAVWIVFSKLLTFSVRKPVLSSKKWLSSAIVFQALIFIP